MIILRTAARANVIKSTKCKPSVEFGGCYIRIFGLKTPCMHMY